MDAVINFKVINPDFNQEYADTYNDGKESNNNMKFIWATTYGVKEIKSVELIENEEYSLLIKTQENHLDIKIPSVTMFRIHLENGASIDFAVSKSVLNRIYQVKKEDAQVVYCYFYINNEPFSIQIGDNLVIEEDQISEELLALLR